MTTLGDPDIFAAKFELDEQSGGEWQLGRICYVLGGHEIGDYALGTSLRDAAMLLATIVKDSDHRRNDWLFSLETSELFETVHEALFGETSTYDERATDEQWSRLAVLPRIDVFDGWDAYLVEGMKGARIVYRTPTPDSSVKEQRLPLGYFDEVMRETFEALEALSTN